MESKANSSQSKAGQEDQKARKHLDELLDEALRESFPASDVPSVANPLLDEPVDAKVVESADRNKDTAEKR
jgi:hypothetical protein